MQNISVAEEAVISALIKRNQLIQTIDVQPVHFADQGLAQIYQSIIELHKNNQPADRITLGEHLQNTTGKTWDVALRKLADETVTPANINDYAKLVKSEATKRQAMAIADNLKYQLMENKTHAVDEAIKSLMQLSQDKRDYECGIREALEEAVTAIEEAQAVGGMVGIPIGLNRLDELTGGYHDSDLVVVGARPSMGKTAWVLNNMLSASAVGKNVGFISGEQGRVQIAQRLLAIQGSVDGSKIRRADLEEHEWAKLSGAMGMIMDYPIRLNDEPAPNINDIVNQARQWKFHYDVDVIYLDYLQKFQGSNRSDSKYFQVSEIAITLKNLARELKIPVVSLAQINRKVEERVNKRPQMSDFEHSGAIEQEADVIMTIYRDEVYNPDTDKKGTAEIDVKKNRHGPIGFVPSKWNSAYMQFLDGNYNQPRQWDDDNGYH